MATVTKPLALNESLNSTENTPRNIADVLADELDGIKQAINNQSGSGNGHIIQNSSGANMPSENTMQFVDAHLSDDSVGGKTKVETFKAVTEAEYSSETEDGAYIITDGDGAVIEPASEDYVEVTGDGVKTYATLLNELFTKVDLSKITTHSYLKIQGLKNFHRIIAKTNSQLKYGICDIGDSDDKRQYTNIFILREANSTYIQGIVNYSANALAVGEYATTVVSNGTKITLYYGQKKATVDLQTTANRCLMTDGRTVQNATVVDISDKFSVSNNKLRVSAQKNGKRVTLSVSGYDGTFNNGEYVTINDISLYPNVADGTTLGGGIGASNGTFIYTTGYFTSNIIIIYHSQNISVTISQFNVTYDIA